MTDGDVSFVEFATYAASCEQLDGAANPNPNPNPYFNYNPNPNPNLTLTLTLTRCGPRRRPGRSRQGREAARTLSLTPETGASHPDDNPFPFPSPSSSPEPDSDPDRWP